MLRDKPMKGLSHALLVTHLALPTMIITLRQLLVFVNMGWDCRLGRPGPVTYKPPDIAGRSSSSHSRESTCGPGMARCTDKRLGGGVLAGNAMHSWRPGVRGVKLLGLSGLYGSIGLGGGLAVRLAAGRKSYGCLLGSGKARPGERR